MSEAREDAFKALYEADVAGHAEVDTAGLGGKASRLVEGVVGGRAAIDKQIESLSQNWRLSRMPPVDRALLRLGTYELTSSETPVGVVINEIVELAKRFSTERSGPFINGVLSAVAESSDG